MGAPTKEQDDALRSKIGKMLADGLDAEVWPRAATSEDVEEIRARLQRDAKDDLEAKLVIGGFTDYTVETEGVAQPCETCMYFAVHRRFCGLPELLVPVEPEWSCRLWRI